MMKLVFDPLLGGGGGDQNSTEGVKFCVGICLAHINLVLGGHLAPPKKKRFLGTPYCPTSEGGNMWKTNESYPAWRGVSYHSI